MNDQDSVTHGEIKEMRDELLAAIRRVEDQGRQTNETVTQLRITMSSLHAHNLPKVKQDVEDLREEITTLKASFRSWLAAASAFATATGGLLGAFGKNLIGIL